MKDRSPGHLVIRTVLIGLGLLVSSPLWAIGAAPASAPSADPPAAPAAAGPAAGAPLMLAARLAGDMKRTRFICDLTSSVDFSIFTLADPYRIVVDLPEVHFQLPDDTGVAGRGLFSAFRYGMISTGKSRIVLDVTEPVRIDKSFVVPPKDKQPARLVIDVVPTTRQVFIDTNRAYRENQAIEASAKRDRELLSQTPKPSGGRLIVVLDPGHGGIDMGARGIGGTVEKDITLAFSKVLGQKLTDTGLYDVLFTRTDDSFIALGDRIAFARAHHADLFVSIHANSFWAASAQGTTIYTVSEQASDKMVAEIAETENKSDVLAGIDISGDETDEVKDILLDLTRRETRNFGVVFARNLVKELGTKTRMFKVPHQQASFKVLEAPDVPSAMIELGFVSNKTDAQHLVSNDWRIDAATSVVRAIGGYFAAQKGVKAGP